MPQFRLRAEKVLQDCKHAIADYHIRLQEHDLRIRWLSIVTLLRAVGNVLEKVDAKLDPVLRDIIKRKFKKMDENKEEYSIYYEFIKKERDRFIKEYEHGIKRILKKKPSLERLPKNVIKFSISSDVSNNEGGIIIQESDEIISCISTGKYKGLYEKDVAVMAYRWWETVINEIKDEYDKSKATTD